MAQFLNSKVDFPLISPISNPIIYSNFPQYPGLKNSLKTTLKQSGLLTCF